MGKVRGRPVVDRKQELGKLIAEGRTIVQIANELSLSRSHVQKSIKKYGLKANEDSEKKSTDRLGDEYMKVVVFALSKATSFSDLCSILNATETRTRYLLQRFKLKLPPSLYKRKETRKPKKPSKIKAIRAKTVNHYWQEEEVADWIMEFNRTGSERVYLKIYPKLLEMGEIIWRRYFAARNIQFGYKATKDLLNDAIAKVTETLKNYQPDRGRTYSYCQTVLKWYFVDRVKHNSPYEFVSSDFEETYDVDQVENYFDDGIYIKELKSQFLAKINKYRKDKADKKHLDRIHFTLAVLDIIETALENDTYGNKYFLGFLCRRLEPSAKIKNVINDLRASHVIPNDFIALRNKVSTTRILNKYLKVPLKLATDEDIYDAYTEYQNQKEPYRGPKSKYLTPEEIEERKNELEKIND